MAESDQVHNLTGASQSAELEHPVPALTRESTGQSVSGKPSSGLSFQLGKRNPSSARINEILENARERAETMRSGTASPRSPRAPASPAFSPRTNPSNSRPIPEDSSADEMTGIMSRGSDLNYQALNSANFNGSVARSRKASARGSRRSRPASQQSDAYQPGLNMDYARETQLDGRSPSWWKSQLEKFQSVELENTGSVARDHLAIERTFLAWLRTSLAFASIGIAVTQLFRLNTSLESGDHPNKHRQTLRHMGKPLGTTFLGISILILFLGYKRYFQTQRWVMQGKFPASRGTVMIVTFVAFAIMVVSLVVVIAIQPSEREL